LLSQSKDFDLIWCSRLKSIEHEISRTFNYYKYEHKFLNDDDAKTYGSTVSVPQALKLK